MEDVAAGELHELAGAGWNAPSGGEARTRAPRGVLAIGCAARPTPCRNGTSRGGSGGWSGSLFSSPSGVQFAGPSRPRHAGDSAIPDQVRDDDDIYVLAADTLVACGRRELPKTVDEAQARQCLEMLSGRRHRVYGGIAIVAPTMCLSKPEAIDS